MVQCLGVLLFGLGISSWNVQGQVYPKLQQDVSDTDFKFKLIQWLLTLGMVVGAFTAGPMGSLGRWKCIIIMCVIGIIGNAATFFYDQYFLLLIGKFLAGVSAGGINCFCPKYIMESSPAEISGSTGALFQLACVIGIFLNAVIALPYGDDVSGDDAETLYFLLSGLPIVFAVMQILCLSTCFTNDTPIVMMQNKEEMKVREFMTKLYNDDEIINQRIEDLHK